MEPPMSYDVITIASPAAEGDMQSAGLAALSELIQPLPASEFVERHWGARFAHVPAARGKFHHLFSWDVLNEILDLQRFGPMRMRLVREGRVIDPAQYQYSTREQQGITRTSAVKERLRAGATLVINDVEDCHRPLRERVAALEALFRARINVNLYAGFGHDSGFLQHWDAQDTFILQIAGRKAWTIWNPTRRWPVRKDVADAPRPDTEPAWDGDLTDGSLFYIPRGWWHVARPLDAPCLHLTITVNNRTGLDLVASLLSQLRSHEIVRRDLPAIGDAARQQAYYDALKAAVIDALTGRDFAAAADDFLGRDVIRRPAFDLPTLDDSRTDARDGRGLPSSR
jgi:ribosomal protein L16 Arg81 hydroxylase